MAFNVLSIPKRFYKTFSNLRTGIVLLILVVIAAALGTFILQRPATELSKLRRPIRRRRLRLLDRVGLTDVFHAWWFLTLLALVSLSIVLVSVDRFPNAWRFYARPYRKTDAHFRAANPYKVELPIKNAEQGLNAAERALNKLHWPVQTDRRQRRDLAVLREASLLGHGGVRRPRQPAADFRRRHHRRLLRLQRLHCAAQGPDRTTSSSCAPAARRRCRSA